jgi:hypothetical protein
MAERSDVCRQGAVSCVRDMSPLLREALEALQQLGIPGFVTRYPNADVVSNGTVVGINDQFLSACGDKRAQDFLGRTYPQIHGPNTAAAFQVAERELMWAPGTHQRIDEGSGVEVVKVALTADSTAVGVISDNQIAILGYFRISPGSEATDPLSVQMQTARESLRFLMKS